MNKSFKKEKKHKFRILLILALLVLVPLLVNLGLMTTDLLYDKCGVELTANGLNNQNWLEFWRDYAATIVAFVGIYLVWDSANKDRKRQYNEESATKYLDKLSQEEKTLVEVAKVFDMGIVYKAVNLLNNASRRECKALLLQAKDKMDEVHVKFELLTEISDDFKKCDACFYNECMDKRIMIELRDLFYDMEQRYFNMITQGEDCIDKITMLATEVNSSGNCDNVLDQMVEAIHKEIEYLSKDARPKFIRYSKAYVDLKRRHASEIRKTGEVKYQKIV